MTVCNRRSFFFTFVKSYVIMNIEISKGVIFVKKKVSIFVIVVGIVLFAVGLFIRIPGKTLTTYSFNDGEYSSIQEYVGGDAYNYIIGACLIGGEIAGAKTQKAIFISTGLLIVCLGLYMLCRASENNKNTTDAIVLPESVDVSNEDCDEATEETMKNNDVVEDDIELS